MLRSSDIYGTLYHIILGKRREVGTSENWLTFGGSDVFYRTVEKLGILCRNWELMVFLLFQQ